eukprot:m.130268 g.130268  ORF g.130268 m.130268 type:complete len:440 (+) comp29468_c1_seq1:75-1394(+)
MSGYERLHDDEPNGDDMSSDNVDLEKRSDVAEKTPSPSKKRIIQQGLQQGAAAAERHVDTTFERVFSWARVMGAIWAVFVLVMLFGLLPWWCIEMAKHKESGHHFFWKIAFWFAFMAVPISLWDIAQHLRHWNNAPLQRHIVRVMWMPPIYALESWFSLRYYEEAVYLRAARECYEAYVIYNFYMYLLTFLRQEDPDFDANLETRPEFPHWNFFARHTLPKWKMGHGWLVRVSSGPVVYVVLRVVMTIVAFGTQLGGVYSEGESFDPKTGYFWCTWVLFVAQSWAIYCLVYFYKAFSSDLAPCSPLKKLGVVKFVVFFTWLQGVIVSVMVSAGWIKEWDDDQTGFGTDLPGRINDLLICIEMFFVTLVHHKVFSWREYLDLDDAAHYKPMGFKTAFKNLFDINDVSSDVLGSFKSVAQLAKKTPSTAALKEVKKTSYGT